MSDELTFEQAAHRQEAVMRFTVSNAPDVEAEYSSRIFAPQTVTVTFDRVPPDEGWLVQGVEVSGPVRRKGGAVSTAVRGSRRWSTWNMPSLPEWLRAVVSAASANLTKVSA